MARLYIASQCPRQKGGLRPPPFGNPRPSGKACRPSSFPAHRCAGRFALLVSGHIRSPTNRAPVGCAVCADGHLWLTPKRGTCRPLQPCPRGAALGCSYVYIPPGLPRSSDSFPGTGRGVPTGCCPASRRDVFSNGAVCLFVRCCPAADRPLPSVNLLPSQRAWPPNSYRDALLTLR
jgi:hypothetical protein